MLNQLHFLFLLIVPNYNPPVQPLFCLAKGLLCCAINLFFSSDSFFEKYSTESKKRIATGNKKNSMPLLPNLLVKNIMPTGETIDATEVARAPNIPAYRNLFKTGKYLISIGVAGA